MKYLVVSALLLAGPAWGQAISNLPAAASVSSADEVPCSQGSTGPGIGVTRKCSVAQIVGTFTLTAANVAAALQVNGLPLGNINTVAASGPAVALTARVGLEVVYDVTLTANSTFALSGGATGSESIVTLILRQDATAGRTATFASNVAWPNGIAPTLNTGSGSYDVLQFVTFDGGVTYVGAVVASQVASPTVPGVPSGAVATAGNGQVIISATPLPAVPAVIGYTISRGITSGGEGVIATNVALPYNDTGLTNGTPYFYKLAGVNALGTGALSAEVSATPSVLAYGHFASYTLGAYIYTAYNSAFNPGSNPFSMQTFVSPASATPSAAQALLGQWFQGTLSGSATLLYLDTTGKLNASWGISSSTYGTAASSVLPGFQTGVPLWVRADVVPTTGAVTFYTGGSAPTPAWTQLGTAQTSTTTGPVQSITTTVFALGTAYNHPTLGFIGNFYAALLSINGTVITNPIVGASGTMDSVGGYTYTGSGVVYN